MDGSCIHRWLLAGVGLEVLLETGNHGISGYCSDVANNANVNFRFWNRLKEI